MNPKQRVQLTVEHRQPDRVAIDYAAMSEVSGALRARLGLRKDESLDDRLGVDLRGVGPTFVPDTAPLYYADPTVRVDADNIHYDIWGVGFEPNRTSVGFYMDLARSPLRDLDAEGELDNHAWPTADLWDYATIAEQARKNADYWVWAHSRGMFEISWFLRGFDTFMADLALRPERACAVMDRVMVYLMERTRQILEAGAGLIDMIEYNDDVGSQRGLLISPEMWRELVKPRMAAFIAMCKSYDVKIRYHSCGGIRQIIPDLIEIGVDVLNPIQTAAAGMDPEELKREFGEGITLNGGIDTQELLPVATADEVRAETRRLIDVLGADGGYILAPSHVFQPDVPIENVLAVYEAALGRPV